MLTIYEYSNCDTCRKAKSWLTSRNIPFKTIDITEQPPTTKKLQKWVDKHVRGLKAFLNTSGQEYRRLELKDRLKTAPTEVIIGLLAGNGRLIKRPIITDGERATVGFSEAEYKEAWHSK